MSEWKEYRLISLASKIGSGATPRGGQGSYKDKGISLIRSQNVLDFEFSWKGLAFIDDEQAQKLQNVEVMQEDILLNITGDSVARVCMVPEEILPARVNQHVAIIRASDIANPRFILYFLLNPRFKKYMLKVALSGGTRSALTKADIENFPIFLPPLDEQRRIAAILSTLDAKIDLLRRQNRTLEQIAQTLFKRWFVQFEFPFDFAQGVPNEHGQPYKSSGGPMAASELGEIPVGWRVGTLGEIAKNIRLAIKAEDIVSDTPYIGLEHMPRKKIVLDTWGTAKSIESNKFQFKKGQILFGKLRPYFHKVGVAFTDGICSTDILVLSPKKQVRFGLMLMIVSSVGFVKYVSRASEGTRMPRTNWQYMSEYAVVIPDQSISKKFSGLMMSFVSKMGSNIAQIRTLTRLRDTLLPKLMSGKLRVNSK